MFEINQAMQHLSILLDSISAWLFCCVFAAFIVPLILERIVFYIPTLIHLTRTKEVQRKGIFITIGTIVLWVFILFAEYSYLYFFQHNLFVLATVSPASIIAWIIGTAVLIYRFVNFSSVIKKSFYYNAYMKFIEPKALDAYQKFIQDLDALYADDLEMLLQKKLPYMHRQAVLRKLRSVSQG